MHPRPILLAWQDYFNEKAIPPERREKTLNYLYASFCKIYQLTASNDSSQENFQRVEQEFRALAEQYHFVLNQP